ncbi:HTH-type transcriptional regulator / antitoxin HigA [Marinomonas polaris DSM 16579]|jgi:HTH-type transcriptional regulator / antitoxin HigA|uniref:HTH-type transcriptional regulator / antitoxin HigA n=1 Tax=Marinomonas polaris DSM 16579 TaxID=1122206 RepID=A0A1M5KK30_9GAMM|nr:hypothetical protein [Marinomonas polaris]SHG53088.1 HTH-type transcriptional regulator / antitoxin HigA [Marinomonas polaris DSM 16579]
MLVTNEITQMAKAILTQLHILNGISSTGEHNKRLYFLEDLLEYYDENLVIIEALSNVIARYEDTAAEFVDFNKRQTAIKLTTATLTVLMDQGLNNTNQV